MSLFEEEYEDPEYSRARKRAMYLLGSREYSAAELREKLLKNYSKETAEKVAEEMKRLDFQNDGRYAAKLAKELIKNKKYGERRVRPQMKSKGLSESVIEEALGAYSAEDYMESLTALIRAKYSNKIQDKEDRRKTVQSLMRRGYSFGEAKEAVMEELKMDNGE